MLVYCLKCRKNKESENSKIVKIKNGRIMALSNCAVCGSKSRDLLKSKKIRVYL